jgi:hypothetical protein
MQQVGNPRRMDGQRFACMPCTHIHYQRKCPPCNLRSAHPLMARMVPHAVLARTELWCTVGTERHQQRQKKFHRCMLHNVHLRSRRRERSLPQEGNSSQWCSLHSDDPSQSDKTRSEPSLRLVQFQWKDNFRPWDLRRLHMIEEPEGIPPLPG